MNVSAKGGSVSVVDKCVGGSVEYGVGVGGNDYVVGAVRDDGGVYEG